MKIRSLAIFSLFLIGMISSACGPFSLAEDVTPPPDYVTPTPVPTLDLAALSPARPLDPTAGQAIYAEKCAACHGPLGMGDGEQAAGLPVPVPALATAPLVEAARPLDWYQTVSQGRMERFMPGFSSLDRQQKWDVLSYVYTLAASPDTLAAGKTIYDGQCASCHGALGKGDGPAASGLSQKAGDWSNPAALMDLSQLEIAKIIAQGQGAQMPAFNGNVDNAGLLAVAAYIRQLGFAPSVPEAQAPPAETAVPGQTETAAPAATETAQPAPAAGSETPAAAGTPSIPVTATISGTITNGSGGPLPSGLKAVLQGYESMQPSVNLESEIGPDGSFKWEGIEASANLVYLVNVEYGGITFRSQVIHGADIKQGETITAPVQIYDTTTDKAGLTVERMHVFFDFPSADRIQVVQMFLITNPGKKMIVPAAPDKALIEFTLPPGAENLQFQDGQIGDRYVQTASGFGDTAGIFPGNSNHQVLFAFDLPYSGEAAIPFAMPLDVANAIFMVPQAGVTLTGEGLQDGGERTLQEGTLHLYSTEKLASGSTLAVTISGRPGQASAISTGPTGSLFIGGGILVLALVAAAFYFMTRKEKETEIEEEDEAPEEESVESLLDAIVALDDLYKAGQLPKAAYEERRAELKERLRAAREK
jgi:mono/diheme cytochrome c family protein